MSVENSKYAPLYRYLCDHPGPEWHASFGEIEKVLGFKLPKSAYEYPAWWANPTDDSHPYAQSWLEAGWETSDLNLTGLRLTFLRVRSS